MATVVKSRLIFPQHLFAIKEALWPQIDLYDKQIEVVDAVLTCPEVYVPAGNQLGKDFVAGFIALSCFIACQARGISCKIVTTSVAEHHLKVLWGEIGRFATSARQTIVGTGKGQLILNYQEVRRADEIGAKNPYNYLVGRVTNEGGEGMAGHHAEFTLIIGDEASGLDDIVSRMARGWAKHKLWIGNCNPTVNFFKTGCESGPLIDNGRVLRQVIRIRAEDSPNVKRGLKQRAAGIEPDNKEIIPNAVTLAQYDLRRKTGDAMDQAIGLDAQFYKGSEVMWFAQEWLRRASGSELVKRCRSAPTEAIGIDPAEGGDKTVWSFVNRYGLKKLIGKHTADTSVITGDTIALGREHNVSPEKWWFDRGGGGQQHADRLREQGYPVKSIGFGESVTLDPRRGMVLIEERIGTREDRYVYLNRRAQMYHELMLLLDPNVNPEGYALPDDSDELKELHRQLGLVPKLIQVRGGGQWSCYDAEGRIRMLPKNRAVTTGDGGGKVPTLCEVLGCSPDESDALVIGEHARTFKRQQAMAGAW